MQVIINKSMTCGIQVILYMFTLSFFIPIISVNAADDIGTAGAIAGAIIGQAQQDTKGPYRGWQKDALYTVEAFCKAYKDRNYERIAGLTQLDTFNRKDNNIIITPQLVREQYGKHFLSCAPVPDNPLKIIFVDNSGNIDILGNSIFDNDAFGGGVVNYHNGNWGIMWLD